MNTLFVLLFLTSLLALMAGLIRPQLFSHLHIYGRKRVGLIFSTMALIFLILVGTTTEPSPNEQKPITGAVTTPTISTLPDNSQKPTQQATQPQSNTVLVTKVVDGDTIEIEGGQRVRYIGIDTPETVDPRKSVQCFGVEASNKNKELVSGKRVRLEKDVSETDKYGRLLRYVYVGDTFVNLELVKQGYASAYSYPPDVKYQNQFTEAQRSAREQNKGLWGSCSSDTPTATQTPTGAQQPSCNIKGNISSGGKIYHLLGCGSYDKTKIDESQGEHWFCSEEEALNAGWRKALNCP